MLPLALAATLILHYVRSKKQTLAQQLPAGWKQWLMVGVFAVLTVLFGLAGVTAFQGTFSPDGRTVTMEMPLKQGTYYVSVGGSNGLLNMHYNMGGAGRYAVDFNRLGGWGSVASRLFSEDNQDHYIYSDTVFSPCAGIVEDVYDELPERTVTMDMRDVPRGGNILTYV